MKLHYFSGALEQSTRVGIMGEWYDICVNFQGDLHQMEKKALFLTVHDLGTNRKWCGNLLTLTFFRFWGCAWNPQLALSLISIYASFLAKCITFFLPYALNAYISSLSLFRLPVGTHVIISSNWDCENCEKLMFIGERDGVGRVVRRSNLSWLPLTSLPYRSTPLWDRSFAARWFLCCVQLTSTCLCLPPWKIQI